VDILDCEPPGTDCTPAGGEPRTPVDAVERRGPVFVAGRIGVRWMIATPHSLSPALGVHVPFPDTGVVLVPSLAYAVGF
jgi:hypothetical protein